MQNHNNKGLTWPVACWSWSVFLLPHLCLGLEQSISWNFRERFPSHRSNSAVIGLSHCPLAHKPQGQSVYPQEGKTSFETMPMTKGQLPDFSLAQKINKSWLVYCVEHSGLTPPLLLNSFARSFSWPAQADAGQRSLAQSVCHV